MNPEQVAALSVPFPPETIKKKGGGGGFSADYVDHGHVTERLLSVDPEWTWEPLATDDHGVPILVPDGDMVYLWGRMTVCGVTRVEVGSVVAGKNEVLKEAVSDFIKRGAMRFGVALHLWMGEVDAAKKAPVKKSPAKAAKRKTAGATPSNQNDSSSGSAPVVASGDDVGEALQELAARAAEMGVPPAKLKDIAGTALGRTIKKASEIISHEEVEAVNQALDTYSEEVTQ